MKSRLLLCAALVVLAGMAACDGRENIQEKTPAAYVDPGPDPYEQEGPMSDMTLTHVRSAVALQARGATVQLKATGAALPTNLDGYAVYLNDVLLNQSLLAVAGDLLSIHGALRDGKNAILVLGPDRSGLFAQAEADVWAGAADVRGRVVDESGNPVADAKVVAALGDDSAVKARTLTDSAGQYALYSFPARTVLVSVTGPNGEGGFTASVAGTPFPDVSLIKFGVPVSSNNHDFSDGTSGWISHNGAEVSLIDHVENPGPKASSSP